MAKKQTKSPTFAILPYRQDRHQDVHLYYIVKERRPDGFMGEVLEWKYHQTSFGIGDTVRDQIIALLSKAGVTVRYYDPEEKKWMDQSESNGLVPAPGQRDGGWVQPNLEEFKRDYLGVHFGAPVNP